MSRTFGIEIEAFGLTRGQAAASIRSAGIRCLCEDYGHAVPTDWKVVTDGSVPNGFEIVSPILSGDDGIRQVTKVMNALNRAGAKVNKNCGLHVHIGAAELNVTEFKNIAKNYVIYEDFFDLIMPMSRRFNNNRYIQSLRARFGDYSHASAALAWKAIDDCTTIDGVIRAVNGGDGGRYHKLNLTAFWRYRTIEFRQHSGTVDAEKTVNWIKLLMIFVDRAAKSQIRPRDPKTINLPDSRLFAGFFRYFKIDSAMRAHFTARRNALRGIPEV